MVDAVTTVDVDWRQSTVNVQSQSTEKEIIN